MAVLQVRKILDAPVLVSRESARSLVRHVEDLLARAQAGEEVPTIDFGGVEGLAPSFLDELLSVFEEAVKKAGDLKARAIIVRNAPTRLSLKFQAVARSRGFDATAVDQGTWVLSGASAPEGSVKTDAEGRRG
jgi:hypothetical protein